MHHTFTGHGKAFDTICGILDVPVGRAVFEIGALPPFDVIAIVGVLLLWALLLSFMWRYRILERMLGLESEKATS